MIDFDFLSKSNFSIEIMLGLINFVATSKFSASNLYRRFDYEEFQNPSPSWFNCLKRDSHKHWDLRPDKSPCNQGKLCQPWKELKLEIFNLSCCQCWQSLPRIQGLFQAWYQLWKKLSQSLCESRFKFNKCYGKRNVFPLWQAGIKFFNFSWI